MQFLTRLTAPAEKLIPLADMKEHLRVDFADEDTLIERYAASAEARLDGADGILGRALVTQKWRVEMPVPRSLDPISLPLAPVQSIDAATVRASDGSTTALSGFRLIGRDPQAYFLPDQAAGWPSHDGEIDALAIEFTAGYGTANEVPGAIKAAARLLAGALYEHREDAIAGTTISSVPVSARAMLTPYMRSRT